MPGSVARFIDSRDSNSRLSHPLRRNCRGMWRHHRAWIAAIPFRFFYAAGFQQGLARNGID
jgi:hypothetical protein